MKRLPYCLMLICVLVSCAQEEKNWPSSAAKPEFLHRTMFDGIISCWDEKYSSKLIRPETFINQYIDEDRVPLLQTPPFPEYPSGHSVISCSAEVILSALFGESFQFTDSTEIEFGLPARSFSSFREAAEEASISRLYGGIHYWLAIDQGIKQGLAVGNHIQARLATRSSDDALARNSD